MLSFIIRRLLIAILLVANSGDPMADLKGRNPPVPPQVIQTREHQLGLDKPMPQRYWTWLTHFVRGDMGQVDPRRRGAAAAVAADESHAADGRAGVDPGDRARHRRGGAVGGE